MDLKTVAQAMPTVVPMVGTMNIEFLEVEESRALLRLPDQKDFHNHIGGPHAGAMFSLAETASGALVLGNFGAHLEKATPLAVSGTIRYKKVAMGPLLAEARMDRAVSDVLDELGAGIRPQFAIAVELRTEDGTVTGESEFVWTLRPNRT